MGSKPSPLVEQLEARLPRWEKGLYACFGAAGVMLAHGFIKAYENTMLTGLLFSLEEEAGIFHVMYRYSYSLSEVYISPGRIVLWLVVQLIPLVLAAILGFHSRWRKVTLTKRLNLIAGYLLAGWLVLLSLGAQDPLNVGDGYKLVVIVYLLALGLGYWYLRRRKDQAEEIFP